MNYKIAIASILKPVDETRMYHKIGRSLSKAGHEVHIAGFKGHSKSNDIKLYPLFFFKRLSFKRVMAPVKLFRWLRNFKPDIIIITTHELLWMAYIYKALYSCKIIYDIRENYYLNIKLTDAFPSLLRSLIAEYVRLTERVAIKKIDFLLLAEEGYQEEISYIKKNFVVLENKTLISSPPSKETRRDQKIKLLFTGTIAESTGIFECIEMAKQMQMLENKIAFTIAGMCHMPSVYRKLKNEVDSHQWITLIGGHHPVEHSRILELISTHDAAFLYYPSIELVKNKMPTKLYEYLAYNIPILLQQHEKWISFAGNYNAAIPVDSKTFEAQITLDKLKEQAFYTKKPSKEVLWIEEEEKLLKAIDKITG
ncbi:MAG: glycosyltransferase [Candidatus Cyclobacteriaceae bacterium M2_1C_046]